jgi:hypothetical protein
VSVGDFGPELSQQIELHGHPHQITNSPNPVRCRQVADAAVEVEAEVALDQLVAMLAVQAESLSGFSA